jgi:hypothetical protein
VVETGGGFLAEGDLVRVVQARTDPMNNHPARGSAQ